MAAASWVTRLAHAEELLGTLRAGGLNIYFRHSLTQRLGQLDEDLTTCVGQRNLTELGRAVAVQIGRAFRYRSIPVGNVSSSPYCRCVDTARLAFRRVDVVPYLETNGDSTNAGERGRLEQLRSALMRTPPRRVNDVFVAHGNNLKGLNALFGWLRLDIEEAEAVIFRPRGIHAPEALARVPAQGWRALRLERSDRRPGSSGI